MVEGKTTASDPTAAVRAGFDRIASVYDLVEAPLELCARSWRRAQWATVGAERVLDVGVGTGKSIASYPAGAHVTAIDVSPRMLARAARRPIPRRARADLLLADVQRLPFEDETFDVAVTTFVFCSVPDPLQGLREIRRVLKPAGRLSMVEHVLSTKWWLRPPMQVLDPPRR